MALALEIAFGICSLLGVRHAYVGQVRLGVALMFGWWVYFGVSLFLAIATLGLTIWLCLPIWVIVSCSIRCSSASLCACFGRAGELAIGQADGGQRSHRADAVGYRVLVIGVIVAAISQTNAP